MFAELGKPLFDDDMEAWDYICGPPVYQTYKRIWAKEPIKMVLTIRTHSLNRKNNLFDVLRYYGEFSHRLSYLCRMRRSLREC